MLFKLASIAVTVHVICLADPIASVHSATDPPIVRELTSVQLDATGTQDVPVIQTSNAAAGALAGLDQDAYGDEPSILQYPVIVPEPNSPLPRTFFALLIVMLLCIHQLLTRSMVQRVIGGYAHWYRSVFDPQLWDNGSAWL
jgi:hypothetical protein